MLPLLLMLLLAPLFKSYTYRAKLNPTVMINGFGDLEGNVPGSNLPVCQYTLQRARQFTDSISFALAVHPFVSEQIYPDG
jgi:hypothetical protein